MKYTFRTILLMILLMLTAGCAFSTFPTVTDSTTTTATTTTTTTDGRPGAIADEFAHLEPLMPEAINADLILPEPENGDIGIEYRLDGVLLETHTLVYDFPANDADRLLTIRLTLSGLSEERTYPVLFVLDFEAHEQYLNDLPFLTVDALIEAALPAEIKSDFTLPDIEYEDAYISFTSSLSRIYNGRFIFSFPLSDTVVTLTARVSHHSEVRFFTYDVVMKGLASLPKIPEIYIVTENNAPIPDRINYVPGTLTLVTYDENLVATTVLADAPIGIRGRGNSTWFMPKQPFRIKFGTKTALLSEYAEKSWTLLANFTDQTLIRNYVAYNFARSLNPDFAPSATFADVYLNGNFMGNYMISDQIEVTSNRVAIDEKSTATDTGYLIEMDKRLFSEPEGVEGVDYFIVYGIPYAIKSPKTDDIYYTQAQFNYIESYIANVHNCLRNRQNYANLIDIDSFVDWFIVEEVFKNCDSGFASVFMYKDKGGLLKMGPIWDFDLSSGNAGHIEWENQTPDDWYTSLEYKNIWFFYLMKYPAFQAALKARWNELYPNQIQDLLDGIYPAADAIARSRYENFQRWDIIGKNNEWYTDDAVLAATTYEEQVELFYDYMARRIAWMNDAINQF